MVSVNQIKDAASPKHRHRHKVMLSSKRSYHSENGYKAFSHSCKAFSYKTPLLCKPTHQYISEKRPFFHKHNSAFEITCVHMHFFTSECFPVVTHVLQNKTQSGRY